MSQKTCSCCRSKETGTTDRLCPACGSPGPAVPDETLAALLTPQAAGRRLPMPYHLCESPVCSTVYYSEDGVSRFGRGDLQVRVGEKETDPPRPLCYCFGHSYESVRDEWERTGRTTTVDQIEAAMRREGCRCRTANPRGGCCLPQVRRFVAELEGRDP
jgi:hypothetical protein